MSQQTMRGMRLGSQSLESERGVSYSERTTYKYICPNAHQLELNFANDAELPQSWQCRKCAEQALLEVEGQVIKLETSIEREGRSHWEMLLERRTREDLQEILQERLDYIRTRRAKGQADL